MITLLAFGAILFVTCLGSLIIVAFNLLPKEHPLSLLCFGYGLGVGLIGLQMFVYARIGLSFSLPLIVTPWFLFLLFPLRNKISYPYKRLKVRINAIDKVLLVFILCLLGFVFFESLMRPVTAWDAWATWLLKSKVFFIDNGIKSGIFRYLASDYPLLIGMIGTFVYEFIGSINDRVVLLVFSSFYIALSGVFFFTLLPKIGLTKSLLFTFLLLSTQNLIRHGGRYEAGQADLALGYYFLVDVVILLKYIKTKSFPTLILLNIFLGITALIKNEGIPISIFVCITVVFYVIKFKSYKQLVSLLFLFIPLLDWQVYKAISDMPKLPSYVQFALYPDRFFQIVKGFFQEAQNIKNWNLLWIVFLVSTVLFPFRKKENKTIGIILLLVYLQLAMYLLIFMNTTEDPTAHIKDVFDRLLLHIAPTAMLTISYITSDIINSSKIKRFFND